MIMRPEPAPEERQDAPQPPDARRRVADTVPGRTWEVWEADTTRIPGAPRESCLIFDGRDVVRRVWAVPDDWRAMTDEGLLRLMRARLTGDAPGGA